MDLSIVVPSFNVECYIERCLDSLVSQIRPLCEIIVIDDASTDSTWEKIKAYEGVRAYKNSSNMGLGYSRNKAIDLSLGEYILFIDSDDWIAPGAVGGFLDSIESDAPDVIVFDYARVFPFLGSVRSPHEATLALLKRTSDVEVSRLSLLALPPMACFKLYRKSVILDNNIRFGNGYYEDICWSYSISIVSKRISVINEVLYFYYQRPGSILRSRSHKHLDVLIEYGRLLDFVKNSKYEEIIREKMIMHLIFLLYEKRGRLDKSGIKELYFSAHSCVELIDEKCLKRIFSSKDDLGKMLPILKRGNYSVYLVSYYIYRVKKIFKVPGILMELGKRLKVLQGS